jgi:hypothetical protein
MGGCLTVALWTPQSGLRNRLNSLANGHSLQPRRGGVKTVDPDYEIVGNPSRPSHPLLFVDATAWIAATTGSNASRALRIRDDPRVSLKSEDAVPISAVAHPTRFSASGGVPILATNGERACNDDEFRKDR